MISFSDTVSALSGNQAAETQLYQADSTCGYPELANDSRLRADWDSEMDVCSVEESEFVAVKWNIAGLYGPFAEFFFFVMKKDEKKRPSLLQRGQACDQLGCIVVVLQP